MKIKLMFSNYNYNWGTITASYAWVKVKLPHSHGCNSIKGCTTLCTADGGDVHNAVYSWVNLFINNGDTMPTIILLKQWTCHYVNCGLYTI